MVYITHHDWGNAVGVWHSLARTQVPSGSQLAKLHRLRASAWPCSKHVQNIPKRSSISPIYLKTYKYGAWNFEGTLAQFCPKERSQAAKIKRRNLMWENCLKMWSQGQYRKMYQNYSMQKKIIQTSNPKWTRHGKSHCSGGQQGSKAKGKWKVPMGCMAVVRPKMIQMNINIIYKRRFWAWGPRLVCRTEKRKEQISDRALSENGLGSCQAAASANLLARGLASEIPCWRLVQTKKAPAYSSHLQYPKCTSHASIAPSKHRLLLIRSLTHSILSTLRQIKETNTSTTNKMYRNV